MSNDRIARRGLFFMIIASIVKDNADLWLVGLMFFVGAGSYFFTEWDYMEDENER